MFQCFYYCTIIRLFTLSNLRSFHSFCFCLSPSNFCIVNFSLVPEDCILFCLLYVCNRAERACVHGLDKKCIRMCLLIILVSPTVVFLRMPHRVALRFCLVLKHMMVFVPLVYCISAFYFAYTVWFFCAYILYTY